jgi:hypothetical protein
VYVLALVNLSINRFLLSALSAGLPRVVDGPLLLTANSLTPTLGAGAAFVGGAAGLALGLVLPAGRGTDATVLVGAAVLFAAASALATRMSRGLLGPEHPADGAALRRELRDLARGLADGARHLVARRTPARALGVMAVHRFLYGAVFIAAILMSRNLLAGPGGDGLAIFGTILGVLGVGSAVAVVLTPVLAPRTGPHLWIVLCLALAAVAQLVLAATAALPAVLVVAGIVGLSAQGAKIAIDTIVQRDTHDDYRGRAFALYDVLYNAAFVGAAALAALALPDTGHSPGVFIGLAVVYAGAAVLYRAGARREVALTRPTTSTAPGTPAPR